MDYKKVYDKIIEHRVLNPLDKDVYFENHHIIPRSLGGSDDKINLVKLTAREHFVCHLLLSEIYPKDTFEWYKMNHAFLMMCSTGLSERRYVNSRLYELKRKDFSVAMSWNSKGEKNSQFGRPRPTDVRDKIKLSLNRHYGKEDGLSARERKKIQRNEEIEKYTFEGKFFNSQKRKTVRKIFGIDLESDFNNSVLTLKEKLEVLYIVEKKSTVEIANQLNADSETIRNYLKLFEVPLRNLSESIKNSILKADVAQR